MPWKTPSTPVASAARTVSGDSGPIAHNELGDQLVVYLNVTAHSGTSPTLDVFIDWSPDGVTFFTTDPNTVDRFTQVTTTNGAVVKAFQMKGPWYRVRWTIAGTSPSYTFTAQHYVTT